MEFHAVLDLRFTSTGIDDARAILHRMLSETRAFDGNLAVEVMVDVADPHHVLVLERWESEDHDDAYREFRKGPGASTDLAPLLAAPPTLTRGAIDPAI